MRKPRRLLLAEPADEFAGEERRLRFVLAIGRSPSVHLGQVAGGLVDAAVRRLRMAAVAQPGQPLPFMFRQELARRKAGKHALVAGEMRVAGGKVARVRCGIGVAEQRRIVPRPPRHQGDIVETGIERRTVAADAVVHLVEPGIEAGARRRTGRCTGIMAPEQGSLTGQRIDVRSFDDRVPDGGQAIAPPLVGGDQENIRSHATLDTPKENGMPAV